LVEEKIKNRKRECGVLILRAVGWAHRVEGSIRKGGAQVFWTNGSGNMAKRNGKQRCRIF